MLKKLTALFISVLLVVSFMAVPVMAEEAVTMTVAYNATSTDSPNGYFVESESNYTKSNMSNGNYKTYYLNITEAGDYQLTFKTTSFSTPKLDVELDGIPMGTCIFDGKLEISYTQIFGVIGLSAGNHKLKLTCKAGVCYLSDFTLTRVGEQTKSAYSFKFATKMDNGNVVMDPDDGNEAVAANAFGQYENLYASTSWVQFLLPENYVPGWYKINMECASTKANPLVRGYLGDSQATASNIVGNQISYGRLTCATATSGYGATGYSSPGHIYLDGSNRYLTFAVTDGDTRVFNVYLTSAELTDFDGMQIFSRALTNPNGSNNNGAPDNGIGTNQTLTYSIPVSDAGDYHIKAFVVDNLNASGSIGTTITASVNGVSSEGAKVTSNDWGTFEEIDIGLITLPEGTVTLSIKGSGDTSWRLRDFSITKAGAGSVDNYTVSSSSYKSVNPATGFSSGSVLNASNWAAYRLPVDKSGYYKITATTAIDSSSSKMKLWVNNSEICQLSVPNSGYFDFVDGPTWYTYLDAGTVALRFEVWNAATRFSKFTITPVLQTTVTDSQSAVLTALGTRTEDTLTIKGPEGKTDVVMIAALYNGDTLINADVATVVGSQLVASLNNVTIAETDNCNLKVFYWDSLETMTPVCSYYILK